MFAHGFNRILSLIIMMPLKLLIFEGFLLIFLTSIIGGVGPWRRYVHSEYSYIHM